MLALALIAFLALVIVWFFLPGGTTPTLSTESIDLEPAAPTLARAEA